MIEADGPLLEIDLGAIQENWRRLDALGPAETGAAVKADAYGCGAAHVGRALAQAGCRTFFVASLGEARALSVALAPGAALYVLNGYGAGAPALWPEDPRIRPVLNTLAEAAAFAAAFGAARPAALQIETGMNRLGLTAEEQAALRAAPPRLDLRLILSHLATADAPDSALLAAQKAAFDAAAPALKALYPAAKLSLAATGAALCGPAFAYDLIRPGIGLYGGAPFAGAQAAVRLSAPLLRVSEVPPGARSGYGGAWRAHRAARLATLPLGYADGIPRALGGKGLARIGAALVPIAGRISMDLTVLDVSDLDPAPAVGDRAYLLDKGLTIEAMAARAGTIGYEILTGLDAAGRVARRWR